MRFKPQLSLALALSLVTARADITTDLIAHWTFDEGSGAAAADSSTNNNHASLVDFPVDDSQWIPGRIGGALRINGGGATPTDDRVLTDNPIVFGNQDQFTFSFWMMLDEPPGNVNPRIISPYVFATGGQHWVLWNPNIGVGINIARGSPEPQLHVWRHFVVVYNRAAPAYSLYVDGVRYVTDAPHAAQPAHPAYTKPAPGAAVWVIGHQENINHGQFFRGALDDVRIYNRLLSESDVQELYQAAGNFPLTVTHQPVGAARLERDDYTFTARGDGGASPIAYQWQKNGADIPGATGTSLTLTNLMTTDAGTYRVVLSNATESVVSSNAVLTVNALPAADITSDLVAHWAFDESAGSAAADSSGNNNHASLLDFVTDDSQWVTGRVGARALQFNAPGGTSDDIVVTDAAITSFANHDEFTFSFWARQDPAQPSGLRPRFITPLSTHWVLWAKQENTGVGFWTSAAIPARPSTVPSSNVWHHFVVVFERLTGLYTLYVDGLREVVEAGPYTRAEPISQFWTIGHSENLAGHADSFNGMLDDVRIYNRLFTINDVEALHAAGGVLPLEIIQQPAGLAALPGSDVNLTAEAEGGSLSYQWRRSPTGDPGDEVDIPGATTQTLSLTDIQLADAGFYRLRVTNSSGVLFSDQAQLTVYTNTRPGTLQPLWRLKPADRYYLTSGTGVGQRDNLERGLTYNRQTGHAVLNARDTSPYLKRLAILDGETGDDLGRLDSDGVAQGAASGTFCLIAMGAGDDGAVYGANYGSFPGTVTTVYRWENESAPVTVAFAGDPSGGLTNLQWGRSMDVRGAGTNTQILLISSSTATGQPVVAGLLTTPNGTNFTATGLLTDSPSLDTYAQPDPPNSHAGVRFGKGNTFWLKSAGGPLTLMSFDPEAGTATTQIVVTNVPGIDECTHFAVDNGRNLLATLRTAPLVVRISNVDNFISPPGTDLICLFDISNPASPVLLDTGRFEGSDILNRYAYGAPAFGEDKLVALDTNNGLVAFRLPPLLSIAISGNSVILSWPAAYGDEYTLESSEGIAPATWDPVAGAPVISGDTQSMTLSLNSAAKYFRLSQ